MEVYRRETEEILQRFLKGRITSRECMVGLDVAFAAAMPLISNEQMESARQIFFANMEAVQKEISRRSSIKRKWLLKQRTSGLES
jgi:hypothetical protein